MKHVVQFSGGVGSWAAAKRVAEKHGTENLVLLFADTLIEDEDVYRFLGEAAANVGGHFVRIADGRTPWEVFRKERIIGSSFADPCSKHLKRNLLTKWVKANCDPDDTTIYLGIDWSEYHRFEKAIPRFSPYKVDAPLCDPPYLTKRDWLKRLTADEGISPPSMYAMGFPHANCGGFCVKAGQSQFRLLLKMFPDRYKENEAQEEAMRSMLGKDVSVLWEQVNGVTLPLTMRTLRERIEAGRQIDMFDWGGCGCAID